MTNGDNASDAIRAAIAVVVRDNPERLRRAAVSQLYDRGLHHEADDVVVAAILEVLEKVPTDVENWEAYLVTVVKRRAIDFIRSAAIRYRDGREAEIDEHPDERSSIEMVEEGIDTIRIMERAVDALDALDNTHRAVAHEHLWRGRRQSDIAVELGVTQARVSQLLNEAKREIRRRMEGGLP